MQVWFTLPDGTLDNVGSFPLPRGISSEPQEAVSQYRFGPIHRVDAAAINYAKMTLQGSMPYAYVGCNCQDYAEAFRQLALRYQGYGGP